jgi:hypothetical protein
VSTPVNDGYYEVIWPQSHRLKKNSTSAARNLEGKTIAQLWDYLFQGDKVFAALEEGLKARYPGCFISWREFGNTHGKDERQLVPIYRNVSAELGVDAAISGMGCWEQLHARRVAGFSAVRRSRRPVFIARV